MRKLAILAAIAVVIIKHRRRSVPHVSVYELIGSEQARLLYLLTAPKFNEHIAQWKRQARVVGLMHLAGNRPDLACAGTKRES